MVRSWRFKWKTVLKFRLRKILMICARCLFLTSLKFFKILSLDFIVNKFSQILDRLYLLLTHIKSSINFLILKFLIFTNNWHSILILWLTGINMIHMYIYLQEELINNWLLHAKNKQSLFQGRVVLVKHKVLNFAFNF